MEVNLEILKDKKNVKELINDFSMKEEYYKFHDYIKKSGVKFEIQEYHDLFIIPLKHSENELYIELMNEYFEINPKIIDFYEANYRNGLDKLYSVNASTISSNLSSHQKAAALNQISKSIVNTLIQLGENENHVGFRQCRSFVEVCDVDCVLSLGRGWC